MKRALNPMELPEVIRNMGTFLPKRSLARAIQVSKTFQYSLTSTLWERVVINHRTGHPYTDFPSEEGVKISWETLELHASEIRHVTIAAEVEYNGVDEGDRIVPV